MKTLSTTSGRLVRILLAVGISAGVAAADAVYTYTGNPFNVVEAGEGCPSRCSVTVTIDLSSPLSDNMPLTSITPAFFSITDGVTTIDSTDAYFASGTPVIEFSTNGSGQILTWDVAIATLAGYISIETRNIPSGYGVIDQSYNGSLSNVTFIESDPGTWTEGISAAPEPCTLLLLGAGLLGIAGFTRNRSSQL